LVKLQLELPGLKAVLVHSFGSGNIPTRQEFLEVFREARKRNILLIDVSQCRRGPVELGIYETSAELLEAGFVAAADITWEAAQCKVMSLLADPDIELNEVEALYQTAMAGEQSTSLHTTLLLDKPQEINGPVDDKASSGRLRLPARPLRGLWDASQIDRALLRLHGARLVSPNKEEPVTIRLFVNLDEDEPLRSDDPYMVGIFRKWPIANDGLVGFDATNIVRSIARPGERISMTIVVDTYDATLSWARADLALFIRETGR
jgi:hypothetical protein